jgi:hypothetical protein
LSRTAAAPIVPTTFKVPAPFEGVEAALEAVDEACAPLDGVPVLLLPGAVVLATSANWTGYVAVKGKVVVMIVDPLWTAKHVAS